MPRQTEMPISKHHIALFDEDWDFLEYHYGRQSTNQLGTSAAIRAIIHRHVMVMRSLAIEITDARQRSGAERSGAHSASGASS